MLILTATFALAGCRGLPSARPPIHVVFDMDNQPKYKAQSSGEFFPDGAAMQLPPEGTVARGSLDRDSSYHTGRVPESGEFLARSPEARTLASLERGRERFNIYCAVCHGRAGDGKGIMLQRGYVPPPTFHNDLIRNYPDGRIFDVITHGVRNMPAYGLQVPPEDRWHIINYLRALQRSQNATLEDIPEEQRAALR